MFVGFQNRAALGDIEMARPPRIEYEGALYHVTSRGNDRQAVFFTERDCAKFLEYLVAAKEKYGCLVHAYVLMTNHYHLLIETPRPNLSQMMHFLNGSYTAYINVKRRRSRHLFQGRFKALIVDRGVSSRTLPLPPFQSCSSWDRSEAGDLSVQQLSGVEAPCGRLQGIFEVQGSEEARFPCCSLTPQQAAGNVLAMHFHSGDG
jgi:REP element-mobilizing transposase RayT